MVILYILYGDVEASTGWIFLVTPMHCSLTGSSLSSILLLLLLWQLLSSSWLQLQLSLLLCLILLLQLLQWVYCLPISFVLHQWRVSMRWFLSGCCSECGGCCYWRCCDSLGCECSSVCSSCSVSCNCFWRGYCYDCDCDCWSVCVCSSCCCLFLPRGLSISAVAACCCSGLCFELATDRQYAILLKFESVSRRGKISFTTKIQIVKWLTDYNACCATQIDCVFNLSFYYKMFDRLWCMHFNSTWTRVQVMFILQEQHHGEIMQLALGALEHLHELKFTGLTFLSVKCVGLRQHWRRKL